MTFHFKIPAFTSKGEIVLQYRQYIALDNTRTGPWEKQHSLAGQDKTESWELQVPSQRNCLYSSLQVLRLKQFQAKRRWYHTPLAMEKRNRIAQPISLICLFSNLSVLHNHNINQQFTPANPQCYKEEKNPFVYYSVIIISTNFLPYTTGLFWKEIAGIIPIL